MGKKKNRKRKLDETTSEPSTSTNQSTADEVSSPKSAKLNKDVSNSCKWFKCWFRIAVNFVVQKAASQTTAYLNNWDTRRNGRTPIRVYVFLY